DVDGAASAGKVEHQPVHNAAHPRPATSGLPKSPDLDEYPRPTGRGHPATRRPRPRESAMGQSPRNGKSGRHGNGHRNANGNGKSAHPRVTELPKITVHSDTRDILAHASKDRDAEPENYFIVDVDAHVTETAFWSEVTDRIDNDVYRQMAKSFRDRVG